RPELRGNCPRRNGAELEHLRPRQDRVGNLVQLSRRHHEDDVRGRFFDRLEQRVERLRRKLVDFVDDEYLVAIADRRDGKPRDDDFADVVDPRVAGGVDLEDVDVAPLCDLHAGLTHAARLRGRSLYAIERLGEDAGGGRLARAARPGKDEGMRNPAAGDGVAQRARDRLLADDLVKALRSPFSRQNLVGHAAWELVFGI